MNDCVYKRAESICSAVKPFDFTKNSTIACGGFSPVGFYPNSIAQMQALLRALDDTPYTLVGNVSNILPSDGEIKSVIVCTKQMNAITQKGGLFVESGVTSASLLKECLRLGVTGAEFLTGIPCTIGGALFMNAGVSGKYIAELVESVLVLRGNEIVELPVTECGYAYKTSVFMQNSDCILGATLRLTPSTRERVYEQIAFYAQKRKHLPKGKSMGCVFKNPANDSAGALIEGAGLKGLRMGKAVISTAHANFIINEGGATARDIRTLIMFVKNAVYAQYKVRLEEEIRYL